MVMCREVNIVVSREPHALGGQKQRSKQNTRELQGLLRIQCSLPRKK